MNRKEFVKIGCTSCLMAAAGLSLSSIMACGTVAKPIYKTKVEKNKLRVPLKLLEEYPIQFIRPEGWQYDIAVCKQEDGSYSALLMQCTHMDYQLNFSQNSYICALHGSVFNREGEVIKGPAEIALKKYTTEINSTNLFIYV